jgi:release factor glutamine methyltransferase
MFLQQAYQLLQSSLIKLYDENEATVITNWVIESITGYTKLERIVNKKILLTAVEKEKVHAHLSALMQNKPIQYVLQESWFAGMKFYVNENVLIPRPETEELVDWIAKDFNDRKEELLSFMDIGTGSGCIAISLKKKIPDFTFSAVDISNAALNIAQKNAADLNTIIQFLQFNFLDENNWQQLNNIDCIISNPPYVRYSEKVDMKNNVLSYEPHLALFVSDEDPLIFYKKIAEFGLQKLNHNGCIYVEMNENLYKETEQLFRGKNYTTELRKDLQGKYRMLKASLT